MVNTFNVSCTEVYEIIKKLPEKELEKIPQKEIEFLEKNMDKSYSFECNENILNPNSNISLEAKAMIIILWEKYFASDLQRQKLKAILERNQIKVEEEKRRKYSYEMLFERNSKTQNLKEKNHNDFKINENTKNIETIKNTANATNIENALVVKKEGLLSKIKNFFKKILKK